MDSRPLSRKGIFKTQAEVVHMTRDELLDICLSITGFFEGGSFAPNYTCVTGNFDGQGISVGALQWAGKVGSLGQLMREILKRMPAGEADAFFTEPHVVTTLALMSGADTYNFVTTHFPKPKNHAGWKAFLATEASIAAQRELAGKTLDRALSHADQYAPWDADNPRVVAFFFDLLNQSGGMKNSKGKVTPLDPSKPFLWRNACDLAVANKAVKTSAAWTKIAQTEGLTVQALLWYAWARAYLSLPQWRWNACVRRGTIATRVGYVNSQWVDLTEKLP